MFYQPVRFYLHTGSLCGHTSNHHTCSTHAHTHTQVVILVFGKFIFAEFQTFSDVQSEHRNLFRKMFVLIGSCEINPFLGFSSQTHSQQPSQKSTIVHPNLIHPTGQMRLCCFFLFFTLRICCPPLHWETQCHICGWAGGERGEGLHGEGGGRRGGGRGSAVSLRLHISIHLLGECP